MTGSEDQLATGEVTSATLQGVSSQGDPYHSKKMFQTEPKLHTTNGPLRTHVIKCGLHSVFLVLTN